MDRKKKTILVVVIIIILFIIGLLVIFSPRLISRLTGNVNNANNDEITTSEFVNNVCNVVTDNENFLTFSGTIIEDFGDEGTALVTIKNDNMVLTKDVTVKSNEYTNFNYVLPRGTYNVTVTKDGYETYETEINESTNLDITLHSSETDIAVSNHVFYNVYYDFYTDGTIHLKTIGNLNLNQPPYDDPWNAILITNYFFKYFENEGIKFDTDFENDQSGIGQVFVLLYVLSVGSGNQEVMQQYISLNEKLENGECNANNLHESVCGANSLVYSPTWHDDFDIDYAKKFVKIILDMPVPTNLVIDDSVAVLPSLTAVTAPELTINNNILYASPSTFSGAKIGTFTVNSNVLAQTESFAAESQINNLIIGEGVTSIGESAFDDASIDNITLPSTLTEIGVSAFEDAKINAITIPESITVINDRVFQNATLAEVKLPSKLTSIGQYAFYGTKLTSITIPGSVETIGRQAFYDSSLTEVRLQEGLKTIEMDAFYGTKLTSVTIPASVISISSNAFSNTPLTEVIIEGDKTRFNSNWRSIGFPESLKPSE